MSARPVLLIVDDEERILNALHRELGCNRQPAHAVHVEPQELEHHVVAVVDRRQVAPESVVEGVGDRFGDPEREPADRAQKRDLANAGGELLVDEEPVQRQRLRRFLQDPAVRT